MPKNSQKIPGPGQQENVFHLPAKEFAFSYFLFTGNFNCKSEQY